MSLLDTNQLKEYLAISRKHLVPVSLVHRIRFMFIRLFGPHPSVGASRLCAGLERSPNEAGLYISKGMPAEFKFKQHAPKVLLQVQSVYEKEFLPL